VSVTTDPAVLTLITYGVLTTVVVWGIMFQQLLMVASTKIEILVLCDYTREALGMLKESLPARYVLLEVEVVSRSCLLGYTLLWVIEEQGLEHHQMIMVSLYHSRVMHIHSIQFLSSSCMQIQC